MGKPLAPGVYEHPVTDALAPRVEVSDRAEVAAIKPEHLPAILARHVATEVRRAFAHVPASAHLELGLDLSARVTAAIAEATRHAGHGDDALANALAPPPRRLLSVGEPAPGRPTSPLSASTLFTRSHLEPRLSAELANEIECADRVDVLVAFITIGGVRSLREALERLALRTTTAPRLRILTTAFTGTTEVAALDVLSRLPGGQVRISLDTRRTPEASPQIRPNTARKIS